MTGNILAITNQKGGVGKTTTAINLSQALALNQTGDSFGHAVSTDGENLIVSALYSDSASTNAGCAYIFTLENGEFVQNAKLVPNSERSREFKFGTAVQILGTRAFDG